MDLDEAMLRNYAGWHVPVDDDLPRPPEGEPLASGQRKRYLRDLAPATGLHRQPHGVYIPKQTAATA